MCAALGLGLLVGCGEDKALKTELAEMTKDVRGHVPSLPEVKPSDPFPYAAAELPDPFRPAPPKVSTKSGGKYESEISRPKEPLEAIPLESIKMVGTLFQSGKGISALVKSDVGLSRVTVGKHLGQNYGLITSVTSSAIELRELYQDSSGDWAEKTAVLNIEEGEAKQ
jgi:type IV pilus assembly protein PilP